MVELIHGRLDMFMASQVLGQEDQPACSEQHCQHPPLSLQLLLSEALVPFSRHFSMRASIQLYPPGLEGSHQVSTQIPGCLSQQPEAG